MRAAVIRAGLLFVVAAGCQAISGGDDFIVAGGGGGSGPSGGTAGTAGTGAGQGGDGGYPNGAPCVDATECLNGYCVDGRCCDGPCNTLCYACAAIKGVGQDGVCSAVPTGWDPDEECAGTEQCDGDGACQVCPSGAGGGGGAKSNGECCDNGGECYSGNCADGVCCNNGCDWDICIACREDLTGHPTGSCSRVHAGTDPRDDCPGAQVCDGFDMCVDRVNP